MRPSALDDALLARLAGEHGTPLWVYDADTIRARIDSLRRFDAIRYAQKANSNLGVLDVARRAGVVLDAVSAGEVERGLAAGFEPQDIVFTADLFDRAALAAIAKHAVGINVGSPFMLADVARVRPGAAVTLRVNPGFGHGHGRKVNTGGETSKHGIWHASVPAVLSHAASLGLRVTGVHVHIGSGSDFDHLTRVCDALRQLATAVGDDLETISAGGGLPIPYRAGQTAFDVDRFTEAWLATRATIERDLRRRVRLEVEPGRYLVAEAGVLVTEVRGTKTNGGYEYVFVDAGFHNLLRPAMYGAYHTITPIGAAPHARSSPKVVAGPLCESADVFTQGPEGVLAPIDLPDVLPGSLVCVHDAGAYGAAMSSNYNSQPAAAEVLVDAGSARVVRRRQTIEEMLAPESRP